MRWLWGLRLGSVIALSLWLAACGGLAPKPTATPQDWEARRAALQALAAWQLTGRVAARDADQGWSGQFVWTWTAPSYQLSLQGPLHQQGALIEGDATRVRARLANGAEVTAADAETLLAQQLGVSLPVTQLRAWVLGIPAAGAAIETLQFDAEGQLQVLEQAGWRVEYQAYQAVGAWYLPKRLTLNYEAIQARLVLDAWRVP